MAVVVPALIHIQPNEAELIDWDNYEQRSQIMYFEGDAARLICVDWDPVQQCPIVTYEGTPYKVRLNPDSRAITARDILHSFNIDNFEVVQHWAEIPMENPINLLDTRVEVAPLSQLTIQHRN